MKKLRVLWHHQGVWFESTVEFHSYALGLHMVTSVSRCWAYVRSCFSAGGRERERETVCYLTFSATFFCLQKLDFLPFEGNVYLSNPDHLYLLIEDYGSDKNNVPRDPNAMYFGRWVSVLFVFFLEPTYQKEKLVIPHWPVEISGHEQYPALCSLYPVEAYSGTNLLQK